MRPVWGGKPPNECGMLQICHSRSHPPMVLCSLGETGVMWCEHRPRGWRLTAPSVFFCALFALGSVDPASAQFVCTTTPSDVTCTNSGTSGNFNNNTAVTANANTTNFGTVNGFFASESINGNATTTNNGSVT